MSRQLIACGFFFFSFGVLSGYTLVKWNAMKEQVVRCENCQWLSRGIDRAEEQWMEEEGLFDIGPASAYGQSRIPLEDRRILDDVARAYNLDLKSHRLLYTIYIVENGGPGREMGVLLEAAQRYKGNREKSLRLQAMYAAGTIQKRFDGNLETFAARWCPLGAENDPQGLNRHWLPNARKIMAEMES